MDVYFGGRYHEQTKTNQQKKIKKAIQEKHWSTQVESFQPAYIQRWNTPIRK